MQWKRYSGENDNADTGPSEGWFITIHNPQNYKIVFLFSDVTTNSIYGNISS